MSAAVGAAGLALAAAGCFAVANTLQHHAASQPADAGRYGLGLHRLLTRPAWLVGIVFDLVGMIVHALALSSGALAIVQPVLVTGLLFALPVNPLLTGRRVGAAEYGWSILAVTGLAVFLLAAQLTGGHDKASGAALGTGIAAAAGLIAALVLATRRPGRPHRAGLFGLAAGTAFGVVAALTKQVTTVAVLGVPALLTTWPLYALLAAGAAGVLLSQAAYRAGPLTGSLPVITITDPVVAIALGVIGFGETLAGSATAAVSAIGGFTAMTVAAVALAQRSAAEPAPQTSPAGAAQRDKVHAHPAACPIVGRRGEFTDVPHRSPAPVLPDRELCPAGTA